MPDEKTSFSIDEAAEELGYTKHYLRQLVRKNEIKAALVPISPGARVFKYLISKSELERFRDAPRGRSRRTDGRSKFLFYATFDEAEEVIETLEENGLAELADLIQSANELVNAPQWVKDRYGS